jgi:hypothetical protein
MKKGKIRRDYVIPCCQESIHCVYNYLMVIKTRINTYFPL